MLLSSSVYYKEGECRMETTNNKKGTQSGAAVATTREVYDGKVAVEAFNRAGRNQNLHGHVHEIIYRDTINANPANIKNGVQATLTKSPTAVRDDIVVKQGGKVIQRCQLKDTSQSVSKTVQQVKNQHYKGTNLMGTQETTKLYEAAAKNSRVPVSQQMHSTGISSNNTKRIASQVTGATGQGITAATMKQVAKTSGVGGAIVGGGIEAVRAGVDLIDGQIDGGEFVGRVAKETVGGGLSAAGGSVAASVAATGAATVLATTAAPVWVPAAVGVGAAIVVGGAVKSCFDNMVSWFW